MAQKVQFLLHQLGCKCGETEFIYHKIFDSPLSSFNKEENSHKKIFLTKVNDNRCVYLCVLKVTEEYTEGDWKEVLDKFLRISKNLKNLALLETLGYCNCCSNMGLKKFDVLEYINSKKKGPLAKPGEGPINLDLKILVHKDFSNSTYKKVSLYDYTYNFILKRLHDSWRPFFDENRKVVEYISNELLKYSNKEIYPPLRFIYRAFELCPLNEIKVILIGQDPYPNNPGEAMGIAFGVPKGINTPASLRNIKKKVEEAGYTADSNDLTKWARQGVFLINTALTVEAKKPLSHADIWTSFTTRLIIWLSHQLSRNIVWVLWGGKAHSYGEYIKKGKVVKGPHPVARGGLWNNYKIFKDIDNALHSIDLEIDWNL